MIVSPQSLVRHWVFLRDCNILLHKPAMCQIERYEIHNVLNQSHQGYGMLVHLCLYGIYNAKLVKS